MKNYSIKSIREEFKSKGVFYTPPELALYIKGFLPEGVKEVYDPTCGNGGLLSVFEDYVVKYGQDINAEQLQVAEERMKNFVGVCGDTLTAPAFLGKKFDYIVANPPFSIKWQPVKDERFADAPSLPPPSKADYAFILHILYYLSDTGMAAVLNFPGILYRGNKEGDIRRYIVERNYVEKVVSIPPKKFEDTSIATVLLVFNKNKSDTNIEFIDVEKNASRVVAIEEVASNDYCLSVNLYLPDEKKEIQIDTVALEDEARANFIKHLRAELDFDMEVCRFENRDFGEFVQQIKAVLKEYE